MSWSRLRDLLYLTTGAWLLGLAMALFLIPGELAAGGVSGLALVIHAYTRWPVGLLSFLFNLPLFWLGWRYLGGPRFAWRTVYVVVSFSLAVDAFTYAFRVSPPTDDLVLQALYGGVLTGIAAGLIYRGKGTSGGTDILARIVARRWHVPMAQSYLASDTLVLLAAGATFGWEKALYALMALYVAGLVADGVYQGIQVSRTVWIVSEKPEAIARMILQELNRGATVFQARGAYTGHPRQVVFCVLSRSEVPQLKARVREIDPKAFVVIGQALEVVGEGFRSWEESEAG